MPIRVVMLGMWLKNEIFSGGELVVVQEVVVDQDGGEVEVQ